jgi:polyvinyl alcohol dehydrogenase (cytochrome)
MIRRTAIGALATAGCLAAAATLAAAGHAATAALNSYPAYLGGPQHTSYVNKATTITPANAGSTHSIWTWRPVPKGSTRTRLDASPITNAGVTYIGAETGDFYAINATTGVTKWRKTLPIDNCGNSGIVSSGTVARDPVTGKLTVYVGAADHYLYALSATTGATIWRTLIGGTDTNFYNWSSPTVTNGHIYMGVATACDTAGADGLVALDQHTGTQTGRYFTAGTIGGAGASVYTAAAVAADGSVFITTGDENGASTQDATSIVKLAEGTLARLDGYQVQGLTGLNLDFNASPTLFMAGTTPMVGACDKNGVFYALMQSDLSAPMWTRQLGIPPATGSLAFCGGSAIFDGTSLYVGADAQTPTSAPGSMYRLNPTDGQVLWYTPLDTAAVVGSPSLDGAGLLAVPTYNIKTRGSSAVYLIAKTDGSIRRTITYSGPIFAQPVFANGELLVAGPTLQAYVP